MMVACVTVALAEASLELAKHLFTNPHAKLYHALSIRTAAQPADVMPAIFPMETFSKDHFTLGTVYLFELLQRLGITWMFVSQARAPLPLTVWMFRRDVRVKQGMLGR